MNRNKPRTVARDSSAERAVLAAMLMVSAECVPTAADLLEPSDFFEPAHGDIFAAILEAARGRTEIDTILVESVLQSHGKNTSEIRDALLDCTNRLPETNQFDAYCERVKNLSAVRSVGDTAARIYSESTEPIGELDDFLDRAETSIHLAVERRSAKNSVVSMRDAVDEAYRNLVERSESPNRILGTPTGFERLDEYLGGFCPGDFTILGGRPGMGKTALAISFIAAAAKAGRSVIFFSLEMSRLQISNRLLSMESSVDGSAIRSCRLHQGQMNSMLRSASELSELPIYIDDTAGLNVLRVRHTARLWHKKLNGLGLIVVDYLQLMRPSRRHNNREQEVSEISQASKALAKELNVPVVSLSQLKRETDHGGDKRPKLSDLRESGSLEQDADNVLFLYRDEYYNPSTAEKPNPSAGTADLIIAKQRNGRTGIIKLQYDAQCTRFGNLDASHRGYEHEAAE